MTRQENVKPPLNIMIQDFSISYSYTGTKTSRELEIEMKGLFFPMFTITLSRGVNASWHDKHELEYRGNLYYSSDDVIETLSEKELFNAFRLFVDTALLVEQCDNSFDRYIEEVYPDIFEQEWLLPDKSKLFMDWHRCKSLYKKFRNIHEGDLENLLIEVDKQIA